MPTTNDKIKRFRLRDTKRKPFPHAKRILTKQQKHIEKRTPDWVDLKLTMSKQRKNEDRITSLMKDDNRKPLGVYMEGVFGASLFGRILESHVRKETNKAIIEEMHHYEDDLSRAIRNINFKHSL